MTFSRDNKELDCMYELDAIDDGYSLYGFLGLFVLLNFDFFNLFIF